jgi:hypothetical protein
MKVGCLEEKAAAHGHGSAGQGCSGPARRAARPVSHKEIRSRHGTPGQHHFIHRKKIGQQAALGTVELFEKAPEMLVELIRALRIDDVYGVDPCPSRTR